jgi:NADPH2:quinone reductase
MAAFKAYRVHEQGGRIGGRLETLKLDDLDPGDVLIKAAWSNVNYKDALAATGAGKIMRRLPMVAGIDVAGHVQSSTDTRYREGDPVAVIGCGLGEDRDGGFSEFVRVPADLVMPLPSGLTVYEAMALGTAGFTAALGIIRMEENHQQSEHGPILVNGATGGVGSFTIDMLAARGYEVTAFTGKRESEPYLKQLGATDVLYRGDTDFGERPLERALWGGAVDSVGGNELAWLTRTVKPLGNIASIGLAGGYKFSTTVMPFILRGINLLGINSVLIPMTLKMQVIERLASDLKPSHMNQIVNRTVDLVDLSPVFEDYIQGRITGRTVVKIAD